MLTRLAERVYAVPGGVNVGVIRSDDGRVILIDTGINETNGKKVLKAVREDLGGEVVAILTTHGHADHFGANAAVVKRTGARVYVPALDEAVLRYPLLQPSSLYGGADPLDALRRGFLVAHPSPVDVVVEPGRREIEGVAVEVVRLAGHSMNQVGYLVDGVFFCADVVLPESVLAKYRIPYLFSVTDHLQALTTAAAVECSRAVPGHGAIVESLVDLISANRTLIEDVSERVAGLCAVATTAEAVLTGLLRHYEAPVTDASGFYLLQPTVFAFLSHLERTGRITNEIRNGESLWAAV